MAYEYKMSDFQEDIKQSTISGWTIKVSKIEIDPWMLCFKNLYIPGNKLINYVHMKDSFTLVAPNGIEHTGLVTDIIIRSDGGYSVMSREKFERKYGKEWKKTWK